MQGKDFEHLKIELNDIQFATENFAENYCIGSGGYGKVYKAVLHLQSKHSSTVEDNNKDELPKIGKTVAIKRIFSRGDKQGEDGFFAEIEALTSCKNSNIISLLGFCVEGPERILVYEHASNGSLDDYLESIGNRANLSWTQRIRICLGIARGLHYLHSSNDNKQNIIHRDIKSANILLDKNWEPKIADLGLSKLNSLNEGSSTINTIHIAGTEVYLDPEYMNTGKLKKATDVYSLGVVLFEILCGRVAYDQIYMMEDDKGLGPIARRRFNEGTLKEMIDPVLKQESDEILFTQNEGLINEESLATFFKIAYRCLAESQAKRPTMEVVIKELELALSFQENSKSNLRFSLSLEDIKLATQNFSENNIIGEDEIWQLYTGEVPHANGSNTIIAKRFTDDSSYVEEEFVREIINLYEYKHKNIIGIVGYCKENNERIIIYENASKGRLDGYLKDVNLTWMKRLKISIDVASGLEFLHGGNVTQDVVVHRNIRSTSILLDGEWNARIVDLGFSLVSSRDPVEVIDIDYTSCTAFDPQFAAYDGADTLSKESDIYSFGVVLLEILCGTSSFVEYSSELGEYVRSNFPEGKLDERVFEGMKEQIVPQSLATFQETVLQCLHYEREERPTAAQVLMQLKKALEFQEDHETWEPKLPKDYKEIIMLSKTLNVCSTTKKEDIYNMLFNGILLGKGKSSFSVGSNGERNEMISARNFTYKNRWSRKWRPVLKSRFHKVAKMLDISNLKIQAKVKPQFLSRGVNYGVHLVFRFCDPKTPVAKRTYVNLKYKMGSETFHTYFATWREDGWMMIELHRFLNHEEDTDFEFLLESFSRCYCESHNIYIQGIEFRAINNVKHEEIKKLKEVQQLLIKSDLNMEHVQQFSTNFGKDVERFETYDKGEKLFLLNEVNKKKHYMLSAKEALYKSTDEKLFNVLPSTHSRSQNAIELLRQQVFRIKCKIESQRLSPDTEYACYIVFKLSEKCHGLHCPVIVRELSHRKNKNTRIIYFRSPSPYNVNDTDQVPEEREDSWREVNVWRFNSSNKIRDDCVSINLKLISYEGTMSGLIINNLEFRPM
ncbi:hypothetical protein Lser_V15G01744 [Lactuca serriola]